MKKTLIALALAALATPAFAQSSSDAPTWSGFYFGGSLGVGEPVDSDGGRILFDTNLDGNFGDTVRTTTNADAFSPGFCGGAAGGRTPGEGCGDDKGGTEIGARVGYDWQMGGFVFGAVAEYATFDARDSVTAFSTTPASYTMTRELDSAVSLRGRVGYAFGEDYGWLAYVTGGATRARIDNSFTSTNTANAFTQRGEDRSDGVQYGLGIERRLVGNFSMGLEYLRTEIDDEDFRVRTSRGTQPATNPFILVNPAGTDFKRSDDEFKVGSVRLTANWRF